MLSRIAICAATLISPAMLRADGHDTLSEALPDRFIAYVFEEAHSERRRGYETGVVSVTSLQALRDYVPEEQLTAPYEMVGIFGWENFLRSIATAERFDCPFVGEDPDGVLAVAAFQGFFDPVFHWTMVNQDNAETTFQRLIDQSPNQPTYALEQTALLASGAECDWLRRVNRFENQITTGDSERHLGGVASIRTLIDWVKEQADVVENTVNGEVWTPELEREWFDRFLQEGFAFDGQFDERYKQIRDNPEYPMFAASYRAAIDAAATTIPDDAFVIEISVHNWGNIENPDRVLPFPRNFSQSGQSDATAPAPFYGVVTIDWRLPGPVFGTSFAFNHLTACDVAQSFPDYLTAGWQRAPTDGNNQPLATYVPFTTPPVVLAIVADDSALCATVFSSSRDFSETEFAGEYAGINPVYLTSYRILENYSRQVEAFLE